MVRIKKISIQATSTDPNPGNATAHCPHHFFAVSGGFHISINGRSTNPSDSPPVSMILGSRAVARSWAVTGARDRQRPLAPHRLRLLLSGSPARPAQGAAIMHAQHAGQQRPPADPALPAGLRTRSAAGSRPASRWDPARAAPSPSHPACSALDRWSFGVVVTQRRQRTVQRLHLLPADGLMAATMPHDRAACLRPALALAQPPLPGAARRGSRRAISP